jgi:hypothetical protein
MPWPRRPNAGDGARMANVGELFLLARFLQGTTGQDAKEGDGALTNRLGKPVLRSRFGFVLKNH